MLQRLSNPKAGGRGDKLEQHVYGRVWPISQSLRSATLSPAQASSPTEDLKLQHRAKNSECRVQSTTQSTELRFEPESSPRQQRGPTRWCRRLEILVPVGARQGATQGGKVLPTGAAGNKVVTCSNPQVLSSPPRPHPTSPSPDSTQNTPCRRAWKFWSWRLPSLVSNGR